MPHATELIAIIALGLVLAFLCGMAAQRLRLPPLVGYLLAGVLVGLIVMAIIAGSAVKPPWQPRPGCPARRAPDFRLSLRGGEGVDRR